MFSKRVVQISWGTLFRISCFEECDYRVYEMLR